jgi:di/tricarboxylate transporter
VTLHLQEPGVAIVTVVPQNPSFGGAWDTAKTGLVRIMGGVMISALWLAPFAALALLGFAVWRRLRPPAPQV